MDFATFSQSIANSIMLGSVYAIIAIGLALAFGVMQMANFAHGEFFMVGAYVVYVFYTLLGWPFPLAVILAFPIVGLLGFLSERYIFRPTRGNVLSGFMATAGLAFILQVLVAQQWGIGRPRPVQKPIIEVWQLGAMNLDVQRLIIIPVAILMIVGLWYFLQNTRLGKGLRACAQDAEAAAINGISNNKMAALAMVISGGFAGVAGALMAPLVPVQPFMGHSFIVIAFVIVIVGGMASIEGAILASFLLGFIHNFVTTLYGAIEASMVSVAFMAIILVVKPSGLLGKVE
jgi:branched-chain amino acid transport system permease protein